jgi:hypothetical protein
MLRRIVVAALLSSLMSLAWAGTAQASSCPTGTTPAAGPGRGVICVPAHDAGLPNTTRNNDDQAATKGSHQPAGCFKTTGRRVPCANALGVWSGGNQCYVSPYNAPAGSAEWQGHTSGSLSMCSACTMRGNVSTCHGNVLWLPPGAALGPPDPGRMARNALGLLRLPAAQVHTAPQAPARTYIGIENWLWLPRAQWASLTKTVTAGGTTVSVRAVPSRVLWDMGPSTKTCYGPGAEWRRGMTDAARTSCGYT